jgi:Tol biopolymer transport system component
MIRSSLWLPFVLAAILPLSYGSAASGDNSELSNHRNPYLGQAPPKDTPIIFAPGTVSTENFEWSCTIAPDGNEILFTRMLGTRNDILSMSFDGEKWSDPRSARFCDGFNCQTPFISPDGSEVFYTARQPRHEGEEYRGHGDIWTANKVGSAWVNHHPVDIPTYPYYGHASPSEGGTLFSGTVNEQPLVRFKPQGEHYIGPEVIDTDNPENLHGMNPFIAPDESYILFSDKRTGGFGGHDIYVSFRQTDAEWSEAKNLGNVINGGGWESCPTVSPDGKYLFFTSDGDIYWVNASVIDALRPAQ